MMQKTHALSLAGWVADYSCHHRNDGVPLFAVRQLLEYPNSLIKWKTLIWRCRLRDDDNYIDVVVVPEWAIAPFSHPNEERSPRWVRVVRSASKHAGLILFYLVLGIHFEFSYALQGK